MPPQCHCEPSGYPFYCERHKVKKTAHWVRLCQTRPDYFQAWEEGRGPGQTHAPLPKAESPRRGGPGTELKYIIARCQKLLPWWDMQPRKGCGCNDTARWMDQLGPDGCEQKLDLIVNRLEDEAKRRKITFPFRRMAAKKLIRWAIRRARKAK